MAGGRAVLTVASASALALASCAPSPPPKPPATELPAPLVASIAGRPALVTFWATWCDACRTELPALAKLDAYARERGAVVVGVAVGEKKDDVERFVAEKKLAYPQVLDEDFRVADALGERNVPATIVVDREGRIVYRGGALDERALDAFQAAAGVTSQAAAR